MFVFPRSSLVGKWALLSCVAFAVTVHAVEPLTPAPPATAPCYVPPVHWCIKAPYTCKPEPCGPSPCYEKWCNPYCAKPLPCTSVCLQWCKDNYCPKPPVCCFPGDPCPPCVPMKHHGRK